MNLIRREIRFEKTDADSLAEKIIELLNPVEFASFGVAVHCKPEEKEGIQKEIQRNVIWELEEKTKKKASFDSPDVIVLLDFVQKKILLELKPVFVEGKYNKFSREVSQTIHFCRFCGGRGCANCNRTGKTTADSVQEIVAKPLEKAFGASANKFHGAGREDVDVRMLGMGRRFVTELENPTKRTADLEGIARQINSDERVRVSDLKLCEKSRVEEVKNAEHDKLYEALVACEKPFDPKIVKSLQKSELQIEQRTPVRVAKRRADLVRSKKATIQKIELVSPTRFQIRILASAGLYIKEFISGDGDRTKPSVSSVAQVPCKCVELDVLEVIESDKGKGF